MGHDDHDQPRRDTTGGRWILGRRRPDRLDLPTLVHWRDEQGAVVRLITSEAPDAGASGRAAEADADLGAEAVRGA